MAVQLQNPDSDLYPPRTCGVFKLQGERGRKRCDFDAESYNWRWNSDFCFWVDNLKYKRRIVRLAAFEVKFEVNSGD